MSEAPKFTEILGGILAVVSLLAVTYVAVALNNESAQGALYGVIGAAVSYVFRGKVEKQDGA